MVNKGVAKAFKDYPLPNSSDRIVCLVCFVYLVHLVSFVQPKNETNETDQTDSHPNIQEVGMLKRLVLAMATVAIVLALVEASEAGGLFLTEIGTEDVALAGAGWAARAQDASTLFKNPAGMSLLEGNQFQGGLQALYFQSGGFSGTNTPFGGNGGGNPVGVFPAASGFVCTALTKILKSGSALWGTSASD